jgi:hypothetical protein
MMGWPRIGQTDRRSPSEAIAEIQEAQLYPATLNEIRLAAQKYGVLHAYHRSLSDIDNDFYFRIGLLSRPLPDESTRRKLEANVRQLLASERPVVTEVGISDLYVASYNDDTLPRSSTRVWSVSSLRERSDVLNFLCE